MKFNSINPYDGKVIGEYQSLDKEAVEEVLSKVKQASVPWAKTPVSERSRLMANVGEILKSNVEEYARMITLEMGKPIKEARSEINKCAWVCEYYAENAAAFLRDESIETEAYKSYVRHDPLGSVLAIMPWNFPYWQVFRFAAPTLTAGNTGILKHAPNVFGCATQIAQIFKDAGFPAYVFENLIIHHDLVGDIISHDTIKAVTLTGSERAGTAVAQIAGKCLKKSVLELGGNNAFIVWKDADIDRIVQTALTARMLNTGQSCIAAKRFILVKEIYDEFITRYKKALSELKTGNPLDEETQVGPLARKDLAENLNDQVVRSVKMGAQLIVGGEMTGCFYSPTILGEVKPGMPAFDEETFGPLAAMIRAKDEAEAFSLAERSKYGLGVTVCTEDIEKAMSYAGSVSDGAYFVNELVKSDPRLPFGGTKRSGYGRELAKDGIMEFINRKTIYVSK